MATKKEIEKQKAALKDWLDHVEKKKKAWEKAIADAEKKAG